jgi:hypothetical protein
MPAQQGGGLHDAQRRAPGGDAAGQEHEQRAVGRRAAGPCDAAMQDGELVPEERVLGHQRPLASHQIGERADGKGHNCRARGGQESPTEAMHGGTAEHEQAA